MKNNKYSEIIVTDDRIIPPEIMCKCGHKRKKHFKTPPLGCMNLKCECKMFKDVKVWEAEKKNSRKKSYKKICDEI